MIPLMSVGLEIGCEIAYPTGNIYIYIYIYIHVGETAIAGVLTGTYQLGAVPGVINIKIFYVVGISNRYCIK